VRAADTPQRTLLLLSALRMVPSHIFVVGGAPQQRHLPPRDAHRRRLHRRRRSRAALQVNRRTMLHKHKNVNSALERMYSGRGYLTPFEQDQVAADMQRAVESIWNSDEVRRHKPRPQDESRAVIAVIDQVKRRVQQWRVQQ
jgi:Phosphoenolpyruvate carboxylase